MRRVVLIAGAAASLALAAGLFLLAADAARWRNALNMGDVRYRVAPDETDLWRPSELVPLGVASGVLGVGDDVAFRRAVRAFRLGRLEGPFVTDPRLTLLRTEADARLSAIGEGDGDPARRSAAANLLGVLSLAGSVTEYRDRVTLLRSAIRRFERAIALDPSNDDAKHNLELALQRGRDIELAEASGGPNPSPGGGGGKGAGMGDPGSGY